MKSLNQTKRITTVVLSVSILASALSPSFLQANFFDDVKNFGRSAFAKIASVYKGSVEAVKKTGEAIKIKAGSDEVKDFTGKAKHFLKKCLPVIPVLAAIPVGIYLYKRSGKVNASNFVSHGSKKPVFSALTWATKKLFGGALVTTGICGAVFLSWKFFLKKLFDGAVDEGRAKVKQDVGDVIDKTSKRANKIFDQQRKKVIQDVREVRDEAVVLAGKLLDDQRTKAGQLLDDQRAKVRQDVGALLDDQRTKAGQLLDDQRVKVKRDVEETMASSVKNMPGAVTRGALSSGWRTAKGALSGVANGFSGVLSYAKSVVTSRNPEAEDSDLQVGEEISRRRKPRPVDSEADDSEVRYSEFQSFSPSDEGLSDLSSEEDEDDGVTEEEAFFSCEDDNVEGA